MGVVKDATRTETWSIICDLFPLDQGFTTAEAVKQCMASEGWTYNQARNRVADTLDWVLKTGTPDLQRRTDKKWVLPTASS